MTRKEVFFAAHRRWLDECLGEFNEAFGEESMTGFREYHQATCPKDYDPGDLVEFAEDGTAYPHSDWGTNYIPRAVTPWEASKHFID